jgi:glycosyltransferase involved in cell wall biosynthesis
MRILLISLFLPHPKAPHAGGRYVYELLSHLSRKHEVDLVTRYESEDKELLDDLRPLCRSVYPYPYRTVAKRSLVDNLSLIANYLAFSRFSDRFIAAGDYDLVQVEWVEAAILIKRRNIPMLLDAHDVMAKPFARTAATKKGFAGIFSRFLAVMVKSVELSIMRRFDRIITLSDFDRNYLKGLWPSAPVVSVPIPAGLDITAKEFARQPGRILFLASYKYRPVNVAAALWFYREVFPLVRKSVPEACFVIAGYGPPQELTSLTADPQVEVTGFVDDLDLCHKQAAVFVAPILTGGGIIVKLLDALAAGTPTVSTTFGNEGVGAVPGRDLLVADAPQEFAAAVVRLLFESEYADRIGKSGRSFVREYFGREAVMARLDALHAELGCGATAKQPGIHDAPKVRKTES